jgi:hypothetical protein
MLFVLSHAESLVGVDQIDAVVRHTRTVGSGGFGSANVHASIHLHGIDRHDVGASGVRHRHGNIAFTACRWCDDGNLLHE